MPSGFRLAEAFVEIRPEVDERAFASQTKRLEGSLSASMSRIGGALTKTLTPASIGMGAAFRQAFNEFDSGADSMRAQTGKTGKALDNMVGSMRGVAGQVTAPLSEVGEAMGQIASRTGLTGRPLEKLTKQLLDLSALGQEVSAESATRFIGDWSIPADKASGALDRLLRTSQETGVGIDKLMETAVQFGAPLRQLGFNVEDATALIAKWGQEGVNTETAMSGFRRFLSVHAKAVEDGSLSTAKAKLAQEAYNEAVKEHGKNSPEAAAAQARLNEATKDATPLARDASAAFRDVMAQIKDAKTPAEASALAMQYFGAKAGPDMAAAIREGRFELGSLNERIAKNTDTIEKARDETEDWGDKLLQLKNRVQAVIGPVGELGFAVSGITGLVGPAMSGIGQLLERRRARLAVDVATEGVGEAAGTTIGERMAPTAASGFHGKFPKALRALGPLAWTAAAVAIAIPLSDALSDEVSKRFKLDPGQDKAMRQGAGPTIAEREPRAFLGGGARGWQGAIPQLDWSPLTAGIPGALAIISTVPMRAGAALGPLGGFVAAAGDRGMAALLTTFGVGGSGAVNIVGSIPARSGIALGPLGSVLAGGGDGAMRSLGGVVGVGATGAVSTIGSIPGRSGAALGPLGVTLSGIGTGSMNWLGAVLGAGATGAVGTVGSIPGRSGVALGPLGLVLSGQGSSAMGWFGGVIGGGATAAIGTIGSVPGRSGAVLGPLGGTLANVASGAMGAMGRVVSEGIEHVLRLIAGIPGRAGAALADLDKKMAGAGGGLVGALIKRATGDGWGLAGGVIGGGRIGSGTAAVVGHMARTGIPFRVSSAYRPGSVTRSGNMSLHSIPAPGGAKGTDLVGPNLMAIARAFLPVAGSLRELIYTPLGFSIKNGRRVAPYAQADHYGHVHVGTYDQGGWLMPNDMAINTTNKPEPVFTGDQFERLLNARNHVTIHAPIHIHPPPGMDVTALARKVGDVLGREAALLRRS